MTTKKPLITESINTDITTDRGSVLIIINLVWAVAVILILAIVIFSYIFFEQIKALNLPTIFMYLAFYISGLGTNPLIGKVLKSVKKFIQK